MLRILGIQFRQTIVKTSLVRKQQFNVFTRIMTPEQTDTQISKEAAGIKRAASPTITSFEAKRVDVQQNEKPSKPRKKKQRVRQMRKVDADTNVLRTIEAFLRHTWESANPKDEKPASFGWDANNESSEREFCCAPPIPAKLSGSVPVDESECMFDVIVHSLTERGYGIATIEGTEQIGQLLVDGKRPWFFAVPFVLPGERIRIKSVKHSWGYTQADLIEVLIKSENRVEPPCKYFGECSGCQIQHMKYEDQLEFKRKVVENAFSEVNSLFSAIKVNPVWGSPLTLGYRTKLTPHFDIRKNVAPEDVAIGFTKAGQRSVLDIEECIIGTDQVRKGLKKSLEETKAKMADYKKGATLLIRETNIKPEEPDLDTTNVPTKELIKDYITNPKAWVTDVVGDLKFRYPASSFFQNNSSILPDFTGYVRQELAKWSSSESGSIKYLIDAYCGSGLFGIACHSGFEKVLGIEISKESISCANDNAKMNGITNCNFILGDATRIFEQITEDPLNSAVIIDPPRKGSSPEFLNQLIDFGPKVIVYVACGVPAQARDLQYMFEKGAITFDPSVAVTKNEDDSNSAVYHIKSIQPFDLFPQTYHVENILTLVRA